MEHEFRKEILGNIRRRLLAYKAGSAAETESAKILEDVEEVFDESLIKEEKVEVQGGEGRRA